MKGYAVKGKRYGSGRFAKMLALHAQKELQSSRYALSSFNAMSGLGHDEGSVGSPLERKNGQLLPPALDFAAEGEVRATSGLVAVGSTGATRHGTLSGKSARLLLSQLSATMAF